MSQRFTFRQFERSVAKFSDYGGRLMNADLLNLKAALDLFVEFCEKDPIISIVTSQLKATARIDAHQWWEKQLGGRHVFKLDIPTDEESRLAVLYYFLRYLAEQQSPEGHLRAIFRGSDYRVCISKFNDIITDDFVKDLGYKLDEVKENIESSSSDEDDKSFDGRSLMIFAAEGAQVGLPGSTIVGGSVGNLQVASGKDINQVIETGKPDIDEALRSALAAVKAEKSLTEDQREQCALDIAQISQELKLGKPRPDSVFEKIKNLSACAALVHHAAAIATSLITNYGWALPPFLAHLGTH